MTAKRVSASLLTYRFNIGGVGAFLLTVFSAGLANSGIIFDNGSPIEDGQGSTSDFSFPQQQSAETFSLVPGMNMIDGVRWWGSYYSDNTPPLSDHFTIRVFEDEDGFPAALPVVEELVGDVGRTLTGLSSFGDDVYMYTAPIEPIELSAETTYWLSIVNDTPSVPDRWVWTETGTHIDDITTRRLGDDEGWFVLDAFDLAFNLTSGAVVSVENTTWSRVKSQYR